MSANCAPAGIRPSAVWPSWPAAGRPDPALTWRRRQWRDWRWRDWRWWSAAALTAGGAALIPWLVLATCVPAIARAWDWSAAWTGLDSLEALGLLSTGLLLLRKDARYRLTAAATAVLLLTDACLDITTSAPGVGRVLAITMATCLELPASVTCAALAAQVKRHAGRRSLSGGFLALWGFLGVR